MYSFASSCFQTKNLIAVWKTSLPLHPEVYKVNHQIGKRLAFSSLKHIDYSCPMMGVAGTTYHSGKKSCIISGLEYKQHAVLESVKKLIQRYTHSVGNIDGRDKNRKHYLVYTKNKGT